MAGELPIQDIDMGEAMAMAAAAAQCGPFTLLRSRPMRKLSMMLGVLLQMQGLRDGCMFRGGWLPIRQVGRVHKGCCLAVPVAVAKELPSLEEAYAEHLEKCKHLEDECNKALGKLESLTEAFKLENAKNPTAQLEASKTELESLQESFKKTREDLNKGFWSILKRLRLQSMMLM